MKTPHSEEEIVAYKRDNARRVREAAARRDVFVDGMPLRVMVETTADCHLFCPACPYPVPREAGRREGISLHMQEALFDLVAPQVFPHALTVNLSVVGEPLLSPHLDRALDLAREWKAKIELITSAMDLDAAMIRRVGPWTSLLVVSFDGATEATFHRLRAGSRFETVLRNVVAFDVWRKRAGDGAHAPGIHFHPTLSRTNVTELPRLVRLAKVLGADRVSASLMIAYEERHAKESLLRHGPLARRCFAAAAREAEAVGIALELPAVPEEGEPSPDVAPLPAELPRELAALVESLRHAAEGDPDLVPRRATLAAVARPEPVEPPDDGVAYACKFLWNELYVTLDGKVAPCCIEGRPIVGNLLEQDLSSIWNGPAMQTMRRRLLSGDPLPCCKDCNHNAERGRGAYREDSMLPGAARTRDGG